MPFLDRSRRGDPHLEWKVRLFSVAAVLALCGIYFDERWMTGAAIAVLAAAMALRFVGRKAGGDEDGDAEGDSGEP